MDRINLLTMEDVLKVNQLETLEKRIDLVWKLRDFVCERETEEELHDFDKWSVNKLSPIITICHEAIQNHKESLKSLVELDTLESIAYDLYDHISDAIERHHHVVEILLDLDDESEDYSYFEEECDRRLNANENHRHKFINRLHRKRFEFMTEKEIIKEDFEMEKKILEAESMMILNEMDRIHGDDWCV